MPLIAPATVMSLCQSLLSPAVRLYSNHVSPNWRPVLTRALMPFWPKNADSMRPIEAEGRIDGVGSWKCLTGPIDIEPGAGQLLDNKRYLAAFDHAIAAPDLTGYLERRIVPREPALVLYAGAEAGFGAFTTEVLPRLAALDSFGLPLNTLLFVALGLARTRYFQEALRDGVFRPRPVELLRPGAIIRAEAVTEIAIEAGSATIAGGISVKLASVYGPFDRKPAPLLVCEQAEKRAGALLARLQGSDVAPALTGITVCDPAVMPLAEIVQRVAAADLLIAPGSGEAGAALLAPRPGRTTIEVGPETASGNRSAWIASLPGESYRRFE